MVKFTIFLIIFATHLGQEEHGGADLARRGDHVARVEHLLLVRVRFVDDQVPGTAAAADGRTDHTNDVYCVGHRRTSMLKHATTRKR